MFQADTCLTGCNGQVKFQQSRYNISWWFRVLQEEFEKREQLEELKESLEQLLQQEQVKSSELEERRLQQEKMLAEEQVRLEKLEQERQMRDQQYEASFRLRFLLH